MTALFSCIRWSSYSMLGYKLKMVEKYKISITFIKHVWWQYHFKNTHFGTISFLKTSYHLGDNSVKSIPFFSYFPKTYLLIPRNMSFFYGSDSTLLRSWHKASCVFRHLWISQILVINMSVTPQLLLLPDMSMVIMDSDMIVQQVSLGQTYHKR